MKNWMATGRSQPLVTVILPVHNGAAYVQDAIQSLLDQTHQSLQIVVVDDGSTDNTPDILGQFNSDARCEIVRTDNHGVARSLEYAISLSEGEWIARMDADDVARPHRIERQLSYANKHGLDLVGARCQRFGKESSLMTLPRASKEIAYWLFLGKNPIAHPTVFARRGLFDYFNYDSSYEGVEDLALWYQMIVSGSVKIGNSPEVLLDYRVHAEQTTNTRELAKTHMRAELFKTAVEALGGECKLLQAQNHVSSRTARFESARDLAKYGRFLCQLSELLSARFGSSELIFKHWRKVTSKNSNLKLSSTDSPTKKELGAKTQFTIFRQ